MPKGDKTEKLMFNGDELAISVWKSKYAQEGDLHYDQMHRRMAKEFARIEDKYVKEESIVNWQNLSVNGKDRDRLTYESIYYFDSVWSAEKEICNGWGVQPDYIKYWD